MSLSEGEVKGIGSGGKKQGWLKQKCQVLCPEDLYSWPVVVRELHVDWWVKVAPASPRVT